MEVLTPILGKVEDILKSATEEVKGLVGLSVGDILKTVDGVLLDLDGVVKVIADVLTVCIFRFVFSCPG